MKYAKHMISMSLTHFKKVHPSDILSDNLVLHFNEAEGNADIVFWFWSNPTIWWEQLVAVFEQIVVVALWGY